jgi:hypothetical protein
MMTYRPIYIYIYIMTSFKINTTGATSGTGTAYPFGAHEFTPVFSGVRVAQSLVFCVVHCKSSFFPFSILSIILSVLRFTYTASDYLFVIIKLSLLDKPNPMILKW